MDQESDEVIVASPTNGFSGSGIVPESSLEAIKREKPDVIAADGGGIDVGPYYLGSDISFVPSLTNKKVLEKLVPAALHAGCPLIIGNAGNNGTTIQLENFASLVRDIAREMHLSFKLALIYTELDKEYLKKKIHEGKVTTGDLGFGKELSEQDVENSVRIVAMMGVEPIIKALDMGADVILAGRSIDCGLFAAVPIWKGFDVGLALAMGQNLEHAGWAAELKEKNSISHKDSGLLARVRSDHYIIESMDDRLIPTPTSLAQYSMYERRDPRRIANPGGIQDLSSIKYVQIGDRVEVSGARWIPSETYTVKLEGASLEGHRAVCIAGIRCPATIEKINEIEEISMKIVKERFTRTDFFLKYHIYGRDGVMGELEPRKEITSHELAIIIEVIAKTEELALNVTQVARSVMQHLQFEGRMSTAGNFALPFSPMYAPWGPYYRLSINHLLRLDDPCECFPIKFEEIKKA